jgi:hypothetical protein
MYLEKHCIHPRLSFSGLKMSPEFVGKDELIVDPELGTVIGV